MPGCDNCGVSLVFLKEPHINTDTYKKALENNIALTGSTVDYILEGVTHNYGDDGCLECTHTILK